MPWWKRNLANMVSFTRILFLPFVIYAEIKGLKILFTTLFILSFLSDAIDGTIARKLKTESEAGRLIDTVADYIFYPSVLLVFIFKFWTELSAHSIFIFLPILMFFIPKAIGFYYLKTFPHIHLRSWQILSYPLGFWIIVSMFNGFNLPLLIFMNFLAFVGFIEESLIYIVKKEKTDQTVNSIFQVIKNNRT